jgi:SAM-dependent methyltransferase
MLSSIWLSKLPSVKKASSRTGYLQSISRDKRVLHVGCVDAPFFQTQLETGHLLHALLAETAGHVIGVDIDSAGCEAMAAMGFDVICEDIETPSILPTLDPFDVVIAGEVIEHLDNPGQCMANLRRVLKSDGILVVTVPNAFRWYNPVLALFQREFVHPDHTSWYSYSTLTNLLSRNGFRVCEARVVNAPQVFVKRSDELLLVLVKGAFMVLHFILRHSLVLLAPFLGDTLVLTAKPRLDLTPARSAEKPSAALGAIARNDLTPLSARP